VFLVGRALDDDRSSVILPGQFALPLDDRFVHALHNHLGGLVSAGADDILNILKTNANLIPDPSLEEPIGKESEHLGGNRRSRVVIELEFRVV